MMHVNFSKLITRENLAYIFKDLSDAYVECGGQKPIIFVIVGGAAIVINFEYRKLTRDIDAMYESNEFLEKAITQVSRKYDLPDDWINDEFMYSKSYSDNLLKYSVETDLGTEFIKVNTLAGPYLIAMKIKSSRPNEDWADVIEMTYEMRLNKESINYNMIMDAFHNLYGDDMSHVYSYFLEDLKEALAKPIEEIIELKKPTL